jgi:hypothetical protein
MGYFEEENANIIGDSLQEQERTLVKSVITRKHTNKIKIRKTSN